MSELDYAREQGFPMSDEPTRSQSAVAETLSQTDAIKYLESVGAPPTADRILWVQLLGSQSLAERMNVAAKLVLKDRELTRNVVLEEAAVVIGDFDNWVDCTCSECKADAGAHAIKIQPSLERMVAEIRALIKE